MKLWNSTCMCAMSILCLALCLTGCSLKTTDEYDDMELTQEEIQSVKNSAIPVASGSGVTKMETISIYTVDSMEEQLVPIKVRLNADRITPEFVLDEVLTNLEEKVVVEEYSVENDRIYVIFNEQYAPVSKCSKRFERLILDCISNSLLDNLSYIEEVVFQCQDGAYQSDNFSFGEDEVYSSK